jgi:uncharacterized YigZ family protein
MPNSNLLERTPNSARKTPIETAVFTLIEKKSKFIAHVFHVASENEAKARVQELRKKYPDSRHVCYAFKVDSTSSDGSGGANAVGAGADSGEIMRSNDDGEPSGTAGIPILKEIEAAGLSNALCAVVRYFGGTLLGKGGLMRAYSSSAAQVIAKAKIGTEVLLSRISFTVPYDNAGKAEAMAHKACAGTEKSELKKTYFDHYVFFEVYLLDSKVESFIREITLVKAENVKVEAGAKAVYISRK